MGFDTFGGIHAHAEHGILAQLYRLGLAIANQLEARVLLVNLPHVEFDRLEIPRGAGRLQTSVLEYLGDIGGGFAMPFAAGVPALELIVGQKLHVGPPAYPVRVPVAGRGRQHSANKRDRKSTRLNSSHLVISYAVFCLKKKKQI